MLVFFYCVDRPDAGEVRARTRAEHLEYMIANKHLLVFGGPLAGQPGAASGGSTFVLDLPSWEAAQEFLASEPYYRAGLFETVVVRAFRQMSPEPEPGTLESELALERQRLGQLAAIPGHG